MGRKNDLRRVDAIVREFGMDTAQGYAFRDYLHECKESGYLGTANTRGDFTMDELRALAREFLNLED